MKYVTVLALSGTLILAACNGGTNSILGTTEQFGYYAIGNTTNSGTLGNPQPVGGTTQPVSIPQGVANSFAIGLYAGSPSSYTITPSDIDATGCANNIIPCNSGNLSPYLIDGPAASSITGKSPLPPGISASAQAGFAGIFDSNGT
jgi:hypothetical protein